MKWSKIAFYTSLICGTTSLAITVISVVSYSLERYRNFDEARINAKRETVRVTLELERELHFAEEATKEIARDLSTGRLTDADFLGRAETHLQEDDNILDIGIAYKPFTYREDLEFYQAYALQFEGEITKIEEANTYNYTRPKHRWYLNTLNQGSYWEEPELPEGKEAAEIQDPTVGFYTPFYTVDPQKNEIRGVTYTRYSLGTIREFMNSLDLGKTGYGFVISPSGILIYHPNEEYVRSEENLFELAFEENQELFLNNISRSLQGELVEDALTDDVTGQNSWVFLRQIESTGWAVGVVFIQDEVLPPSATTRQKLIWLSVGFVCFLSFFFILITRAYKGGKKRLWLVSFLTTLLFASEIGLIWYLALRGQTYGTSRNIILSDTSIDAFLDPRIQLSQELNQDRPFKIPTGIFVQSLDFVSSNDVFLTGYIWQVYHQERHKDISQGFLLPDALDSNDLEVQEIYRDQEGELETVGWYFEATIRQSFDFSNYPFDSKDVQIRIWHTDFNRKELNRQILLIPDLDSYPVINPQATPGIAEDIVLKRWNLQTSFFEYEPKSYNTKFGIRNSSLTTDFPDLHFTIVLQRAFLAPFIARVGPWVVVITLLFAMLLIADSEKSMEVLGACAGFVFIVILDQIAVRDEIITKGILYFEYFYFVAYLFIFLVALNALLLLSERKIAFVEYQKNLISKLLFFPSLLQVLLWITIFVFY